MILATTIRANMMIKAAIALGVISAIAIAIFYTKFAIGNRVSIPIENAPVVLSDKDAIRYSKIVLEKCGLWMDAMQVDPLAYGDVDSNSRVGRNPEDQSRCIVPWVYSDKNGDKSGVNVYLTLETDRVDGKAVKSK